MVRSHGCMVVALALGLTAATACDEPFSATTATGGAGGTTSGTGAATTTTGTGGAAMTTTAGPGGAAGTGGTTGSGGAGGTPVADALIGDSVTELCGDGMTTGVPCSSAPMIQDGHQVGQAPVYVLSDGQLIDSISGIRWSTSERSPGQWADSSTYCDTLADGQHNDWRVPTLLEAMTLSDYGVDGSVLPPLGLGNSSMWVIHPDPPGGASADQWIFVTNEVLYPGGTDMAVVRCVRGAPLTPTFLDMGAGHYAETLTALEWNLQLDGMLLGWVDALDSCEAGWRLPTVKEAIVLMDPAAPTTQNDYWTSSPAIGTSEAWVMDLPSGRVRRRQTTTTRLRVCVRALVQ